jgi:molybdopterin-guanine dinucleotide biosynthesis protein
MSRSRAFRIATWCWWKASSRRLIPKLEVHRPSVGKPLIAGTGVETIVAVATDEPAVLAGLTALPVLELNDREAIADFILRHLGLSNA